MSFIVNSWTIHVLFPLYQGRPDQPRRYCEPLTGENDGDGEDDILMPGCTKVYYDTFKINIPWLVPIVIKHNDDNLQCIYDDIPTFVKSTAYFQIKVAKCHEYVGKGLNSVNHTQRSAEKKCEEIFPSLLKCGNT